MKIQDITLRKKEYKPVIFYSLTFLFTWTFWISALVLTKRANNEELALLLMIMGLFTPALVSLFMVLRSGNKRLKEDYKNKIVGLYKVDFKNIITAILSFFGIITVSILISTIFGESIEQLSLSEGFSFSIGSAPALLTLILASTFEEFGWRGYAEDSIAYYYSWFKESLIFGCIWSLWHLPLVFIEGTYHYNIVQMNPLYGLNFFISTIPLGFFMTWVYVKNKRSISACIIVHFFINFLQEQIAMTQNTKCIETFVLILLAAVLVILNKEMFFENEHIGNLLDADILKDKSIL